MSVGERKQLIEAIKQEIVEQRKADQYRGFHTEVTNQLETQLRFYECGLLGLVPAEWKDVASKLDPEYAEYIRLKEKFNRG